MDGIKVCDICSKFTWALQANTSAGEFTTLNYLVSIASSKGYKEKKLAWD